MAAATESIGTGLAAGAQPLRCEGREDTLRIVEYSRFPRVAPHGQLRVGFSRDISPSGMCLGVDESEPPGSLLRVCQRDIDGRHAEPHIARVRWVSAERDGRHWLGLQLLTGARVLAGGRSRSPQRSCGIGVGRFPD